MTDLGANIFTSKFWSTLTFKVDPTSIKMCSTVFESLISEFKDTIPDSDYIAYMVIQPILASFTNHSMKRGGNMFGLENVLDDLVLLLMAIEVEAEELGQVTFSKMKEAIQKIETFTKMTGQNVDYRFMNYCDGEQNPLATYGALNIQMMRDAAAKYDPARVFQDRVPGGFKISEVK